MFPNHGFLIAALVLTAAADARGQQIPAPKRVFGTMSERRDDGEATTRLDTELTTRLTLPGQSFTPCQASVSLAYYQRNTRVRVETTIENASCKTGSGTLDIVASIRNAAGERLALVFPERWEQRDETSLVFTRDYPIGENVELLRIRSSKVDCVCQDEGASGADAGQATPAGD